ncbi:MAG: hypothetical protein J1F28_05750 [Oscillospiraceae bacterium]|nr:hypothetical protein [Oscillospiraceae bacterium]
MTIITGLIPMTASMLNYLISALDSLALYFVNAILDMKYYHKNTLVCGDIDKFNH